MLLNRLALLAVILLAFSLTVLATAQYPDKIFYEGKEYMLHSNPMEAYFQKFPDKKPSGGIISSALWRGYVATFEITDGVLRLKDIEIRVDKSGSKSFDPEWKSVIETIVPKGEVLKIDWFTGLLVLPHGEVVNYVHMGYGSTYEKYVLLEITKGILGRSKRFDYKEYEKFKDRQFAEFKKTDEYKKLVDDMKKDRNYDDKFIDDFLRSFVTSYTSKILID